VLAVTAHGRHDQVVAGGVEPGGHDPILAVDRRLGAQHLTPGGVVAHHADDGQPEAHGGVELEAVEAERAVAVDDQHPLVGVGDLGGQGERHADTQRAQRPRIHPGAVLRHLHHLGGLGHDVTAVADDDHVVGDAGGDLPAEP
jgi:hypothetical protein